MVVALFLSSVWHFAYKVVPSTCCGSQVSKKVRGASSFPTAAPKTPSVANRNEAETHKNRFIVAGWSEQS